MGGLFSKPKMPEIPKTTVRVHDEKKMKEDRRRRLAELSARQGRASTDLSSGNENLGT
jgi:hypothetical protein